MSIEGGVGRESEELIDIDKLYDTLQNATNTLIQILENPQNVGGEIFSSIGNNERQAFEQLKNLSDSRIISPGILDGIKGEVKGVSYGAIIEALFTFPSEKGFEGFKNKLSEITRKDFSTLNIGEVKEMIQEALKAFNNKLSSRRLKKYPPYY